MCDPIVVSTGHCDAPWVTADLAVLHEAAVDVRLDVDLQLFAAERTRDQKLVWHVRILPQCVSHTPMQSARKRFGASTAMIARRIPVRLIRAMTCTQRDRRRVSVGSIAVAQTSYPFAVGCRKSYMRSLEIDRSAPRNLSAMS